MNYLPSNVKELRERKRLNQEQLGKLCGYSQNGIAKIEAGITKKPQNLLELADALEVNAKDLWEVDFTQELNTNAVQDHSSSYGFDITQSVENSDSFEELIDTLRQRKAAGQLSEKLVDSLLYMAKFTI